MYIYIYDPFMNPVPIPFSGVFPSERYNGVRDATMKWLVSFPNPKLETLNPKPLLSLLTVDLLYLLPVPLHEDRICFMWRVSCLGKIVSSLGFRV